jgi:SAM-dependent methyltransferase
MSGIRKFAKQGVRALRRLRTKILRRFGFWKRDWSDALTDELQFWEWALKNGGRNWNQVDWRDRTDPNLELQDELKKLIPAPPGSVVNILDVGAGPLTRVGKRWSEREVRVVPVDPLAEKYTALLARCSIQPLVPVTFAHGEKLLDRFEPNSFDLAYASNSLDHSYDPVVVIEQMLAVVKPLHYVYLWHGRNEGVRERYVGLHQWNFDIRKGEFVVSDGRRSQSVTAIYQGRAEVSCEFQQASDTTMVVAKLKKLASF